MYKFKQVRETTSQLSDKIISLYLNLPGEAFTKSINILKVMVFAVI